MARIHLNAKLYMNRFLLILLINLACTACVLGQATESPKPLTADTILRFQEYLLAQTGTGSLRAVVELHEKMVSNDIEDTFVCKFYRVSTSGNRQLVAQASSKAGQNRADSWTQADNFLNNGRQQVLVAAWNNDTHAQVFDFDGQQVRTVYNSDDYDKEDFVGRTYLGCLHTPDGQAVIQEQFHQASDQHPTSQEQEKGFVYVKEQSSLLRVVCWQAGEWRPINFHYSAEEQRAVVP